MADSLSQVLLDVGLDMTPVRGDVDSLKALLEELNASSDEIASRLAQGSDALTESVVKATEAVEGLKTAAEGTGDAEKQRSDALEEQNRLAAERVKATEKLEVAERASADVSKDQQRTSSEMLLSMYKRLGVENEITAKLEQEVALQKEQARLAAQGGGSGSGGGPGGGLHSLITSRFSGATAQISEMLGGITATHVAVAATGVAIAGIAVGAAAIAKKLWDAASASSALVKFQNEYNGLVREARIDGAKLMQRLQEETDGQVRRLDLMRTAAMALRSPYKMAEDDIVGLTKNVVKLSDVYSSAHQGITALQQALRTGNVTALARATGLEEEELRLQKFDKTLTRFGKDAVQLKHVLEVLNRRAAEMKDGPKTVADELEKLENRAADLWEAFGEGVTKSGPFQSFLELLDRISDKLLSMQASATEWGYRIADGFAIASAAALALIKNGTNMQAMVADFTRYIVDWRVGIRAPDGQGAGKSTDIDTNDASKLAKERIAALEKLALAQVKLASETYELLLDKQQGYIAEARRADDAGFAAGLVSLQQHLATEKQLLEKSYLLRVDAIDNSYFDKLQEIKAKRSALDQEQAAGLTPKLQADRERAVLDVEEQTAEVAHRRQLVAAAAQFEADKTSIEDQGRADRISARRAAIEGELQDELTRVAKLRAIAKNDLEQGRIDPGTYLRAEVAAIEAVTKAQVAAARKVYEETAEKTDTAAAALQNTIRQAVADAEQQLDALSTTELDERLNGIQNKYGRHLNAAENKIDYARNLGATGQEQQGLHAVLELLKQQRAELEALYAMSGAFPETQAKIYGLVNATAEAQHRYTLELQRSQDVLRTIAPGVEAIGRAIRNNFTSEFAQELGESVQLAARSLESASRLGKAIRGESGIQDPALAKLHDEATKLFASVKTGADTLITPFSDLRAAINATTSTLTAFANNEEIAQPDITVDVTGMLDKALDTATKPAESSLTQLTGRFVAAVQVVDSFAQSVLSARTAMGGALSGGMGGASFGKSMSEVFGMAGPWGQIAGAIAGSVAGAIVGRKRAAIQRDITDITGDYKELMDEFSKNSNQLQSTISQLEGLIEHARQQQAKSKKGNSEYQKIIDQYSDQLRQLQNQRSEIMADLNKQVTILSAPSGMRDALEDLDSILEAYERFKGAASNAEELARANQFLSMSLDDFQADLAGRIADGEEQAIEDAIKLNDLLKQRVDLTKQYNDAVRSTLTEGILVRQQTRAQRVGGAINDLTEKYQQDMARINMELVATRFRVDAERTIYDLAVGRAELEVRLAQIQQDKITQEIGRIAALRDLLGALGGSGGVAANLQGLGGGGTLLERLVSGAYQSRSGLGFAQYRGQTILA